MGLTATANQRVEEDIRRQLTLWNRPVAVLRDTMDRPNIQLSVLKRKGLSEKLATCEMLLSAHEGCGLIYCATRENVELVAEYLLSKNMHVAAYHAGFEAEDKQRLQDEFLTDRYKALVATNALGMGIDKGNLRFVIHFDVPGSITAYYQEVGRVGRDGLLAYGYLLFDPADRRIAEYFIESATPTSENFTHVLEAMASAGQSLHLAAIKRMTGLHPTRVTIILAELLEQGYIFKSSNKGTQVYSRLEKQEMPNLSRYAIQQQVKKEELQHMLYYGNQTESCRMAFLRRQLGDILASPCGHCDICRPGKIVWQTQTNVTIDMWLQDRPWPIAPMALHKVSLGRSALDSRVRVPLFVSFMKERAVAESIQDIDPCLLHLLLKHLKDLMQNKKIEGLVPLPSRTWKAQESMFEYLCSQCSLPALRKALYWQEVPERRQGELCNNDQRHHNVHKKMKVAEHVPIPSGTLILFDDYIGSGNTMKEAARALRVVCSKEYELIPFTVASIKWHLGKPGFS